jgi:hypothetical protein
MADVFSGGKQSGPSEAEVKDLHAKIGRLVVENDFLYEGSRSEPGKETVYDPARSSQAEHQPTM